jgi:hypothetical protein
MDDDINMDETIVKSTTCTFLQVLREQAHQIPFILLPGRQEESRASLLLATTASAIALHKASDGAETW